MKRCVIPTVLFVVSLASFSFVVVSVFDLLGEGLYIGGICIDNISIYHNHC